MGAMLMQVLNENNNSFLGFFMIFEGLKTSHNVAAFQEIRITS
jgi:hypothetical protein